MIKITISWSGKLKSSEADIVESFVINNHDFISILNKLMNRKSSIIRFYNSV